MRNWSMHCWKRLGADCAQSADKGRYLKCRYRTHRRWQYIPPGFQNWHWQNKQAVEYDDACNHAPAHVEPHQPLKFGVNPDFGDIQFIVHRLAPVALVAPACGD